MTGQSTSPAQTSTSTRPARTVPEEEVDARTPRTRYRDVGLTRARRAGRRVPHVQGCEHFRPRGTPQLGRHRRAGHRDLFDTHTGAHLAHARHHGSQVRRTLGAADAHDAGAVGTQPESQGRPLRRPAHHVLTAPQDADRFIGLVGEFPSSRRHGAAHLPAECAPVAQRRRGPVAGSAPAGVGLDVRGLDPGGLERDRPVTRRHVHRMRQGHRAVTALDASGGGPGGPDPRGQWSVGPQLDERAGRRRVVGEPSTAEHDVGPRALHAAPLHLRSPGGKKRVAPPGTGGAGRVVEAQRVRRGLHDGLPSGAAAQVGAQRRLDVPAGRRRPGPASVEGGEPHDDPRRAEPALARPGRDEGRRPALAEDGRRTLERGHVTPGDAADRRDAGDPGQVVDPHGAAAALSLGAAAVLDGTTPQLLPQHVEEREPVADGHLGPVQGEEDVHAARRVGGRGSAAGRGGSCAGLAQGAECPIGRGLS